LGGVDLGTLIGIVVGVGRTLGPPLRHVVERE
jgi:hypothetical protein